MKLRIEVREGPPSMFNPEAIFYVVAIHEEFEKGEKMLGGPMTEDNALGMIEAIREGGLPKEVQEKFGEPELPLEPSPRAATPKANHDYIIPIIYIGTVVLFIVLVSLFGVSC